MPSALFFYATGFLPLFILATNIVELIVLLKRWSRLVPSMIYLLNLCLTDLLIGLFFGIVQLLDYMGMGTTISSLYISYVFLRVAMVMSGVSLIVITIDRLTATIKPLLYRKMKRKYAIILCLILWVVITTIITILFWATYIFPSGIDYKYIGLFYPTITFATILVLIPSYYKIIKILINQRRRVVPAATFPASNAGQQMKISRKRKCSKKETELIKLTVAIISVYILCWLPLSVYCFPGVFGHKNIQAIGNILFSVASLNALLDPLIYFHHIRRRISKSFSTLKGYFTSRNEIVHQYENTITMVTSVNTLEILQFKETHN